MKLFKRSFQIALQRKLQRDTPAGWEIDLVNFKCLVILTGVFFPKILQRAAYPGDYCSLRCIPLYGSLPSLLLEIL